MPPLIHATSYLVIGAPPLLAGGVKFTVPEYGPGVTEVITGDCQSWCTSLLHFVPAQVAGTWKLPSGQLTLSQSFQMLSGELASGTSKTPIADALMRGDEITFSAGGVTYTGRVSARSMSGKRSDGQSWTATRN